MFGRHHRRPINILFVIFRLLLSVVMLTILMVGIYSAYKHFSGLDPLKLNPQAIVLGIVAHNKDIGEIINRIPGMKGKLDDRSERLDKEDRSSKLDNLISNIQHQN